MFDRLRTRLAQSANYELGNIPNEGLDDYVLPNGRAVQHLARGARMIVRSAEGPRNLPSDFRDSEKDVFPELDSALAGPPPQSEAVFRARAAARWEQATNHQAD